VNNIIGWRQWQYNVRQVKRAYRKAQQIRRSTSKDEDKQQKRQKLINQAHQEYIELSQQFIGRSQRTLDSEVGVVSLTSTIKVLEIQDYIGHAHRQIDQIERRIIKGEKIPHEEKVFSLFQPHTEWISKGKAGVPVELGLKVCLLEDSQGYILHHHVMQHETDDQIAVEMVTQAQSRYPQLSECSFDKGFHSPDNQTQLADQLARVVLPKKGRCNQEEQERESSEAFRRSKRAHSAVESGINALEVHGLDKCLDHGVTGFRRYIALAVVARNMQKLGSELIRQSRAQEKRRRKKERLAA